MILNTGYEEKEVDTGYEVIDEIITQLNNNELEIVSVNRCQNSIGHSYISDIQFYSNITNKEIPYRELATVNKTNDVISNLAKTAELVRHDNDNRQKHISKYAKYFLVKLANKIHNKILPNKAKKGYRSYDFYLPFWFILMFNFSENDTRRRSFFKIIMHEMMKKGYNSSNALCIYNNCISFKW